MTRTSRPTGATPDTGKADGNRPAPLSAAALERMPAGTVAPIALGTATNAFFTNLR